jgi:hypothetical protein
LMLYGMKGSLAEAAGAKEVAGIEPVIGENPGVSTRRYKPKPKENARGPRPDHGKSSLVTAEEGVVSAVVKELPAYKSLSKAKRAELERSMASDPDFAAAITAEPSLLKAWKAVTHLVELKTDVDFLKALQHVLENEKMQKHIFYGDFHVATYGPAAGSPRATGMHSEVGMRAGRVRPLPGTTKTHCSQNPEVYECEVQHRNENTGGWTTKSNNSGLSTIFPASWSKGQTLEELAFAYEKVIADPVGTLKTGNEYFSLSSNGTVEIHFYLDSSNSIKSAFPVKQ